MGGGESGGILSEVMVTLPFYPISRYAIVLRSSPSRPRSSVGCSIFGVVLGRPVLPPRETSASAIASADAGPSVDRLYLTEPLTLPFYPISRYAIVLRSSPSRPRSSVG